LGRACEFVLNCLSYVSAINISKSGWHLTNISHTRRSYDAVDNYKIAHEEKRRDGNN